MMDTWTVYDHPKDFPRCYVARRFDGETPTADILVGPDLAMVRAQLRRMGMVAVFPRAEEDDPKIVETWI